MFHNALAKTHLGRHARRALRLLRRVNRESDLLLDAGVGEAPYHAFMRGRIIGLDIHLTPLTSIVGNVEALPFMGSVFTGACAMQSLYLLHRPERGVAEIFRVLKPGGWLVFSVSRPAAARQQQLEHPTLRFIIWDRKKWANLFRSAGFCDQTPWWERWLLSRVGAYYFALFVKI